jgi:putative transposase
MRNLGLFTPAVIYQKLEYIHNNPLQEKWNLAKSPHEYKWSSAGFYETGEDEFGLFEHISIFLGGQG